MKTIIPYGRQSVEEEDVQAVLSVLNGDWLTCGPAVDAFEQKLCDYTGARHAVAVSNGTAALHVAMMAAGVGEGDRVLTSPNTFLASANCAEYVGAMADFVDIELGSHNLSPLALECGWSQNVKAVVAVDFAGRPCDMPAIAKQVRRQGAMLIEDGSHALGSRIDSGGKSYFVGSHPWADMTTFSFHAVKTLTTGEGGAILTDDDELAKRCRLFRNHGMERNRPDEPWVYEMAQIGFNYRITDLQCALGCSQFLRLEQFISARQKIVDTYNVAFQELNNLETPIPVLDGRPAWHLYVVQIAFQEIGKSRAQVMRELKDLGVGSQVHYFPVHLQTYYRNKYGYASGKCPNAEAFYERCLSLPLFPSMTEENVAQVIAAVREVVA
jgi:perosamine synthetase